MVFKSHCCLPECPNGNQKLAEGKYFVASHVATATQEKIMGKILKNEHHFRGERMEKEKKRAI